VSEFKIGDKVWVLCEVATVYNYQSLYIDIRHDGAVFEAKRSDCRPVEPDHDDHPVEFKVGDRVVSWSGRQGVVEAINEIEGFPITVRHSMREQVSYKLGGVKHDHRPVEPSNSSETPDCSSEPLLLGDAVELQSNNVWRGTKGILTNWCPIKKAFWFESLDPSRKAISGWMKEQWDDEETGICRLVKIDHPNDSPKIPDSSSDALQVGDAVRFVWPGHKWHRTEGTIVSAMGDPNISADIKEYPYRFRSDCGAFERWCSVDQLERINRADPINPSHYKQGGIECIEAIKAATGDGFIGYVWGNVLKYLWRWPKKGGVDDLKKARWYLDRLIQEVGE
jgi:hypothetical protein